MPQEEVSIIRTDPDIKPTIQLDDIIVDDLFEGSAPEIGGTLGGGKSGRQYHKDLGTGYPFVTINNYVFRVDEIFEFRLDATDFIPSIYLKVALTNSGIFKSQSFPKDGDILSIFIRAKNDAFKPIRNDYVLTRVNAGKGLAEGLGSVIEFYGELFIPRFKDEVIKSYSGTSIEVLKKVCRDLGLGFATNETSTNDSMNWICPGDSLENFIQQVTERSWKNDKSFFKVFIDVYYHLNFINVNNQLAGSGTLEAALVDTSILKDFNSDDDFEKGSQTQTKKLLSDMDSLSGTNMFIRQYEVKNNSSGISAQYGYKSFAQFFDQKSLKNWDIFVDPLVSTGAAEDKILLKGRSYPKAADGKSLETYWKTQNKRYWLGVQMKDVHDKYVYAELWNKRNNEELRKMYVEADVERWNPNIYRGEKIPLILITQSDTMKRKADATPDESRIPGGEYPAVADQLYSGWYMVDGLEIVYEIGVEPNNNREDEDSAKTNLYEVFRLTRREWPVPATG